MNAVGAMGIESQRTIASGARVVVIEPNADSRNRLREVIRDTHTFVLAGLAPDWPTGLELVDIYVPELLIVRDTELPARAMGRFATGTFPILVRLSETLDSSRMDPAVYTLALPLDRPAILAMLEKARAEIYARKASDLSQLLDHYLSAAYASQQYLGCLKVDDEGQTIDVPTDEVVSITADGNYVRVQTSCRTYEMRETMTGLSEKLDPRSFIRVHRSFIVNLQYVRDVVDKAGTSSLLLLYDGAEIPIGPNYRNEISGAVNRRLRLTA